MNTPISFVTLVQYLTNQSKGSVIMTTARKYQIDFSETTTYHIISKCARNTWLRGYDPETGRSYEHRRFQLVARIRYFISAFFIDLLEHDVLHNHYHLVIDAAVKQAQRASRKEVVRRYYAVSNAEGFKAVKWWYEGKTLSQADYDQAMRDIELFRERLQSISWLMQKINQPIARDINAEEGMQRCRFWEGRFYSRGLYTFTQVLVCMVYVALNSFRAGLASKPESSEYTGFYERLNRRFTDSQTLVQYGLPEFKSNRLKRYNLPVKPLKPFIGGEADNGAWGIQFSFEDYSKLIDATARAKHADKQEAQLDYDIQPILDRLGRQTLAWVESVEALDTINYLRSIKTPPNKEFRSA